MAQAPLEHEKVHNGYNYDEIFDTFPITIAPHYAIKFFERMPDRVMLICKFTKMKDSNEFDHTVGSSFLLTIQYAIAGALSGLNSVFSDPDSDDNDDNDIFPFWRISVSTFVVILDKDDKNEFVKEYKKEIKNTLKQDIKKNKNNKNNKEIIKFMKQEYFTIDFIDSKKDSIKYINDKMGENNINNITNSKIESKQDEKGIIFF